MGLITRRSQVQVLAPLQSFRALSAHRGRFSRTSFKMRNERGTEQRANGQQRPKSALTALHLRSELVAGPICPLLSAQFNWNLPILLKSLDQDYTIMGLITRRSQVQVLAPLRSFRVLTARRGRFRRSSFKMRNERGTEQRANGQQRPKSALAALHLRSEPVAGPICPLLSTRVFLIRMRDVSRSTR